MNTLKIQHRKMIYTISGISALMAGVLFFLGLMGLIIEIFLPSLTSGRSPWFQSWLIIVFKLLLGFNDAHIGQLKVLNVMDIVLLIIVGLVYAGLYIALRKKSKILSLLALVQPFLGIIIFLTTKTAGRSAVMGAGIVIAIAILRSTIFRKELAYTVALAGVLLLAGDMSAGKNTSIYIAVSFGIGYILMTLWFFIIAPKLFSLAKRIDP